MGEYVDKAKGAANEAMGKARVAVGQKTDSPEMIIKRAKQQAKGQAQKIIGAAKGVLGDKI
ncbi:MAG: CsbD family protein [Novosphingobium sp.]